jgi:hypothetical protein
MEHEGSLPRSEEFANCPCPELYEPIQATLHSHKSYSLKTHFNTIHPLMLPHRNYLRTSPLPHTYHVDRSSHSSWFHHSRNSWCCVQISLFSNTRSLCSSFGVRDQVSHPCKTNGKIIVLTWHDIYGKDFFYYCVNNVSTPTALL